MESRIGRRNWRGMSDKADRPGGQRPQREESAPVEKANRSIRSVGFGLLMAAGIVWAWSCGDGALRPIAPPVRLDSVVVTPESAGLATLGDTVKLRAAVRDQNGFEPPGVDVTWTSSAPEIATVDASGVVTAAGVGSATITATATAAEVHGSAVVTVAPSNAGWTLEVWAECSEGRRRWNNGSTDGRNAPPWNCQDPVGGLGLGGSNRLAAYGAIRLADGSYQAWQQTIQWSASVSDSSVLLRYVPAERSHRCDGKYGCAMYIGRRVGSATVTLAATHPVWPRDSTTHTQTGSVELTVVSLDHPTMRAVHSGLGSPSWPGWGQDTLHLTNWSGVAASWKGKVGRLEIPHPDDAGPFPIPPAIVDLDSLRFLQLAYGFSGSIPPTLGRLANLQTLNLPG